VQSVPLAEYKPHPENCRCQHCREDRFYEEINSKYGCEILAMLDKLFEDKNFYIDSDILSLEFSGTEKAVQEASEILNAYGAWFIVGKDWIGVNVVAKIKGGRAELDIAK